MEHHALATMFSARPPSGSQVASSYPSRTAAPRHLPEGWRRHAVGEPALVPVTAESGPE